ncbi:MAG: hypothetical protein JXA09_14465 [Anaerolineae bacterium]|nr:hypothetical protein [Anaerolineae bacterium]
MRTPAGIECRFYYEDYNRGREIQECRLLVQNASSLPWTPDLCSSCPVPRILMANACPNMVLEARVGRRWLIRKQVQVQAFCTRTKERVEDPFVGCGHCHESSWQETVGGATPRDSA